MILFVAGKDFRPADQIMTRASDPGAIVLEHVKCDTATLPQECWYIMMTGAGEMSLPYYSDQLYKIWRKDEVSKAYEGKHRGQDEDGEQRKRTLDALPTYQPDTPRSAATELPAPYRYDGKDDDFNHQGDEG